MSTCSDVLGFCKSDGDVMPILCCSVRFFSKHVKNKVMHSGLSPFWTDSGSDWVLDKGY